MSPQRSIALLAAWCCAGLCASADVFHLATEGEVRGELLNKDERPRKKYVIRTPEGIEITLDRKQVVKVQPERSIEDDYQKRKHEHPDTVEGHWAMAEWCQDQKLTQHRKEHLERVIELDPEHVQARRALGYGSLAGRWVKQDELMAERGYQMYKGKWVLPQEIELEEERRQRDLAEKDWTQKIGRWRKWYDAPQKSGEAREQLSQIGDPLALKGLRVALGAEKNEQVRLLLVESLGNIGTWGALELLVTTALEDQFEEVRLTALDQLDRHRSPDVTALLVKSLKHKENPIVNRAAIALARQEDPTAVRPLIDALVTKHRKQIVTGGGAGSTSASFSKDGAGPSGLTSGGGPQIIEFNVRNESVRDALVTLTGQNYDFDQSLWKSWYASQQQKRRNVNARRD